MLEKGSKKENDVLTISDALVVILVNFCVVIFIIGNSMYICSMVFKRGKRERVENK